jgi:nitrile hydratase beta subunit
MNGIHDLGGMVGFGAVDVDDDAQFHEDWERLVFVLNVIVQIEGVNNIDEMRHAIERMNPTEYLAATYFERWLDALETLVVEKDVISGEELAARREAIAATEKPEALVPERYDEEIADRVREIFETAAAYDRSPQEPRFAEGESVRVRNIHPMGHTRCPRYTRRATGDIAECHGTFVFPDANAHGEERAEPLYSVAFPAAELWGPDAENPADTVHIDLWEPYLEQP